MSEELVLLAAPAPLPVAPVEELPVPELLPLVPDVELLPNIELEPEVPLRLLEPLEADPPFEVDVEDKAPPVPNRDWA
ncbi:hypothetical protein [Planctomicrobium piriforme]|uniref:Uncharacterized protein n=1 Tax=Planctomicrobium piriforme TaxID=1576369 RepID=A0A1I3ICD7_9PLAN|nr:hypothetical protein [Planctomicrobium piriforme]SFI45611.1 hypothetical protein SAMN05421753_10961 [Planctomicrobium piriforme]